MREHTINHAQEQALVGRARSGEHYAREEIILSLQTWVRYCARSWYRCCSWRSPLLDVSELSQIGSLAMLENLDRALSLEKTFAYLQATARGAIKYACLHAAQQPYSLDVPLSSDSSETFADLLVAPQPTELARCATDNEPYAPLYEAIETELTDRQRNLINRHFGLGERAPESMTMISHAWYGTKKSCGGVYQHRERALARLRLALESEAHNV